MKIINALCAFTWGMIGVIWACTGDVNKMMLALILFNIYSKEISNGE